MAKRHYEQLQIIPWNETWDTKNERCAYRIQWLWQRKITLITCDCRSYYSRCCRCCCCWLTLKSCVSLELLKLWCQFEMRWNVTLFTLRPRFRYTQTYRRRRRRHHSLFVSQFLLLCLKANIFCSILYLSFSTSCCARYTFSSYMKHWIVYKSASYTLIYILVAFIHAFFIREKAEKERERYWCWC